MDMICWQFIHLIFLFYGLTFVAGNFAVVNVDESTAIGTKVHQLPTPGTNKEYTLYPWGDPTGLALFSVNDKGEVILNDQLNYEIGRSNSHYIIAILRDKGKKYGGFAYTRKFEIIDSNNHSPKFAKKMYFGAIEEGLPAGSIVSGLEDCFATDLDTSGIKDYTITEGNNNNEFKLDVEDVDGIKLLVVKTKGTIDRDEIRATPYLDLGVQANDGGTGDKQKFAKTVIRIKILDRNDNPPVFLYNNWRQTIRENAPLGSSVLRISASDNDEGPNAEVYYYFDKPTDAFYINPSSGEISVGKHLNVDDVKQYELEVVAQDKSIIQHRSAKTLVNIAILNAPNYPPTIDKNTIPAPQLSDSGFTLTVRGDLPVKSFVYFALVNSQDPDLVYTMSSSPYFKISRNSGIVSLKQELDRETKKQYTLSISVQDKIGRRDSMALTVNVQPLNLNRFNPIFDPSTVSIDILQDIHINTEIGYTVRARDADTGNNGVVSYHVAGGSGIGRFQVASKTGKITTTVTFKRPGVFDLYIKAQDNSDNYKRYGTMYLRINVKPSYKSPPVLSRAMCFGKINEGEVSDSFVGAVFAASPGPGKKVIYEINGPIPQGLALDRETGVITTTQPLDYEQDVYKFMQITVRVPGISAVSKTALYTEIININDNPPIFTRPSITVHVAENSGDIQSLACLFASDDDGIENSNVRYSIKSGNTGNLFSINSETGIYIILYFFIYFYFKQIN